MIIDPYCHEQRFPKLLDLHIIIILYFKTHFDKKMNFLLQSMESYRLHCSINCNLLTSLIQQWSNRNLYHKLCSLFAVECRYTNFLKEPDLNSLINQSLHQLGLLDHKKLIYLLTSLLFPSAWNYKTNQTVYDLYCLQLTQNLKNQFQKLSDFFWISICLISKHDG